MKADDVPPDVPPAALNPEKDPDEWVTKDEPMTGPQRSYLQTLCREAGEEFDQNWTKAEASKKIEELQQKTGRGKSNPALEMVAGVADADLPQAHVGLHAGPVIFQEGDYYGATVNTAARIADYARPGEVLVSQEVVDASVQPEVVYRDIGPVELKGMAEPMRRPLCSHAGLTAADYVKRQRCERVRS